MDILEVEWRMVETNVLHRTAGRVTPEVQRGETSKTWWRWQPQTPDAMKVSNLAGEGRYWREWMNNQRDE